MNKFLSILVLCCALHLHISSCQEPSTWFNIDCGAESPRVGPNLLQWVTDDNFIKSGLNTQLPQKQQPDEMNNLRYFPYQTPPNCYVIPAYRKTMQYIIRAGFYYGNYNYLSYPPTFEIHINDHKLSTINTSLVGEPVYAEGVYVMHGEDSYSVCLEQTLNGDIPFISSLEIMPLWTHLYTQMEDNVTFTLLARINYGGDEVRYNGPFSDEKYNRVWKSGVTPPNCNVIHTLPDSNPALVENDPPVTVLLRSIESNASHPIILTVDTSQDGTPQLAYLVFCFTEVPLRPALNNTRVIDIYINGQMMHTVATEIVKCKVVTLYPVPVVSSTINITLAQSRSSTLPPIISAMEVFVRPDHGQAPAPGSTNAAPHRFFLSYVFVLLVFIFCLFYL